MTGGWFAYNFLGVGHPWYAAAAWPNVAAMLPCGIVGFAWGAATARARRTRRELLEEIWHKQHTGNIHPRAQARLDAAALTAPTTARYVRDHDRP